MSAPKYGFGVANRNRREKTVDVPGPGTYVPIGKFGHEGRKFTLSGRPKSAGRSMAVPGPAAYTPQLEARSKGFTYRSRLMIDSFGSCNRKAELKSLSAVPGPGQYDSTEKYRAVNRAAPSWKSAHVS